MRWKAIAARLDTLVDELSAVLPEVELRSRRRFSDPEKAADKWVRRYARSRQVPLPSTEVLQVLQARASYAATFARLAPRQEIDVPTSKAIRIVEMLLIDLWHGCFKQKWRSSQFTQEFAFAA